jgi:2-C-methyl-D-erythritol 4-phosphate cytidylyltransferase
MSQGNLSAAAVIVGGGSGNRFGGDKLTEMLAGKPLIAHTLAAFEAAPDITAIVLVVPSGREEEFRAIARGAGIAKLHAVIAGGPYRHESVLNGLKALPDGTTFGTTFAAIHDAARPLVTPELIGRVLRDAVKHGAAAVAAPVTDTLHRVDAEGNAAETVDRSQLRAMQTPQVFRTEEIMNFLSRAPGVPTDEVSVFMAAGKKVFLVEHSEPNPKVTWPQDVVMVEALLTARKGNSYRA